MSALALHAQHPSILLRGDLDYFHKDALLAQLWPATTWGRVTVDLSGVRLVDASALGCFVRLHNAMRGINPDAIVRFIGVRPRVAWLFRLTHLDALFELIESDKTGGGGDTIYRANAGHARPMAGVLPFPQRRS
ncbi:MAG TPA: STAS domain-containing protein [Candidatus Tyrphobacter sp.]